MSPARPHGMPQSPAPTSSPSPAPEQRPKQRGGSKALVTGLITAVIAGGAGIGIGIAIGAATSGPATMDEAKVNEAVQTVLINDYGLESVEDVSCPRVAAEQGSYFECTFTYEGSPQTVTVQVGSPDGQILVGRPFKPGSP